MNDAASAAVVAAALCGLAGLLVPTLIRAVPEPEPDPDDEHGSPEQDEPKVLFVDVAATPGLAWKSAVAAAGSGAVVGGSVGWDWSLLFLLPLVPVGVALAVVDWRTKYIPNWLVRPAFALTAVLVGVCWLVTRDNDDVVRALIALAVVRSAFWVLWWVHAAGMGFGDVRLAAVLALALGYLGWQELVVGIYLGFVLFAVPGLLVALVRWDRTLLKVAYPFGPFMLAGALVGVAVGAEVWT
jgi:leader peptidase (prepilin peptidase)/N-methyltransferase